MSEVIALPAPATMSLAEWASMEEDEPGELVQGRLEEEEMADITHDLIVGWVLALLHGWSRPRAGFVGGSDTKFAMSENTGRKPDVWAYLPGGKVPPRRGPVTIPPDIMVEVVSPTTRDARRDRVVKMDEYARFGVRYYWIVDPELRTVEIWELLAERRYARAAAAASGVIEPVPGCDGLRIDLDGSGPMSTGSAPKSRRGGNGRIVEVVPARLAWSA